MALKKRQLEMVLESCEGFRKPKIEMEQYITPTPIVAEILTMAHLKGDIEGRRVIDLGCGTGRFAIGAKLMGAAEVTGVDKDPAAMEVARENARRLDVDVEWVESDIGDTTGKWDTILQNPPFGVRRPGADRRFLEKGFEMADVIYSIHKKSTREFIYTLVEKFGGRITDMKEFNFSIPHTYDFHKKEKKEIGVDVYRIEVN